MQFDTEKSIESIESKESKEPKYTQRDTKRLLFRISKLSSFEHEQIYDIIKAHDLSYTRNNNGVFISLSTIPQHVIRQINDLVDDILQKMKDRDNNADYSVKKKEEDEMIDKMDISNRLDDDNLNEDEDEDEESNLSPSISGNFTKRMSFPKKKSKDCWTERLNDQKHSEKVHKFIDHLEESIENLHKKKGNIKYANAMKKYGRMYTNDKKFDPDVRNCLTDESFPL